MTQMTGSRRPTIVAAMSLAVMAVALSGCGRKGPLEPPPSRPTTDTVVTTETTPAATPVP